MDLGTGVYQDDNFSIPEKTFVRNPKSLTEEEKDSIRSSITSANPILDIVDIKIDNEGNTTVTFQDGTGINILGSKLIVELPSAEKYTSVYSSVNVN